MQVAMLCQGVPLLFCSTLDVLISIVAQQNYVSFEGLLGIVRSGHFLDGGLVLCCSIVDC